MVKNKVGSPGKACEYDFMFETGINSAGCILDVAEKLQLAEKRVCPVLNTLLFMFHMALGPMHAAACQGM